MTLPAVERLLIKVSRTAGTRRLCGHAASHAAYHRAPHSPATWHVQAYHSRARSEVGSRTDHQRGPQAAQETTLWPTVMCPRPATLQDPSHGSAQSCRQLRFFEQDRPDLCPLYRERTATVSLAVRSNSAAGARRRHHRSRFCLPSVPGKIVCILSIGQNWYCMYKKQQKIVTFNGAWLNVSARGK